MRELADLVGAWRKLPPDSKAVLATVVGTQGSTYRKIGARMLVADGNWLAGSLSGGCLEADLIETAWRRTEAGPCLITYDTTADDDVVWGLGLGCNGIVQVLLERPANTGIMDHLARCVDERESFVLVTNLGEGPALASHRVTDAYSGDSPFVGEMEEGQCLIERLIPPRQLVIFGAGHDAIPLAAIASELGFQVVVFDHRSTYLTLGRFPTAELVHDSDSLELEPGSAVVVMSHHYLKDKAYLKIALASEATYLGLLGPQRRKEKLLAELASEGFAVSDEMQANLFSPIGLDLGAEGPEQVALAICAEIMAVANHREGGHLRDRSGALHAEGALLPVGPKEDPACGLSA